MMMMPSFTSPSSSSSSSSSSSATVRGVDKATSEFLSGPDWTMNMDICDTINSNQLLAKDVVKAVKKRLQHKNPKVQLLALTLLETMVKNCGDYVHFQIAERNILQEMIKIVKKKADMHVRDKILTLLDSWQEAFVGPEGKYPQYYWAYDELRRSGIEFPQRSFDTAPILTPPVTHPTPRHPQPSYGMPINSSLTLDEAMAAEVENLSLSSINSMRDVVDLLADMLQAVNPSDRSAVNDEVIVDLVERCRANQKKLMQMLTTTGDEELLAQGLELNDSLQSVLAKHDTIASGSPLPVSVPHLNPQSTEKPDSSKPAEVRISSAFTNANCSAAVLTETRSQVDEDEDEEDDFAQLARRHSKKLPSGSQSSSVGLSQGITSANGHTDTIRGVNANPAMSSALVLSDPPAPVRTTKEQDMIDLLSLTLSTGTTSPRTPQTSASPAQSMNQVPISPPGMGNPFTSQAALGFNSYVAPWAQPHPQPEIQPWPQSQPQPQFQFSQPQSQPQFQHKPQSQTQPQVQELLQSSSRPQPQPQHQYLQHRSSYPPPPWAPTPGYFSDTSSLYRPNANSTPQTTRTTSTPSQAAREKPFIPSYRLFEDLNVLGNTGLKVTSDSSPTLSGTRN